jgi:hypothetical protein
MVDFFGNISIDHSMYLPGILVLRSFALSSEHDVYSRHPAASTDIPVCHLLLIAPIQTQVQLIDGTVCCTRLAIMKRLSSNVDTHYGATLLLGRQKRTRQSMSNIGKASSSVADQIQSACH